MKKLRKTMKMGELLIYVEKFLLKKAELFWKIAVVNDSGPFHIARAVKTPTFVFFGPTDPNLFSFEKNTFLIKNPNCKPHSLYGDDKFPKKYEDCMSGISVKEVMKKIIFEYEKITKNKNNLK